MSVRRTVSLTAVAVLAVGAFLPATAAAPKFAGTYALTLQPDPTINAFSTAELKNCQGLRAEAVDKRVITIPGAGKFKLILDSAAEATGKVYDWDMYVVDNQGVLLGKGSGATAHEEVAITIKRKTAATVYTCNLTGDTKGKVTYTLK